MHGYEINIHPTASPIVRWAAGLLLLALAQFVGYEGVLVFIVFRNVFRRDRAAPKSGAAEGEKEVGGGESRR